MKYLDSDGKITVQVEQWPIIDIHDILSFLVEDAKVVIPPSKLVEYWQRSKHHGEPWAQDIGPEEMSTTVPLGLYGDSARVETNFGHEHILAFFLNVVLFRPRSVRWSRFLVCAIAEQRLTTATIPAILRRMVWSANHAFYGYFPTVGPMGQPLEGRALVHAGKPLTSSLLKFQVTELRGDWQYHKKIWRFYNTHWNGEHVCHQCNAKGISDSYADLYFNIESNNHVDFSLVQFLAQKMPSRHVCNSAKFQQRTNFHKQETFTRYITSVSLEPVECIDQVVDRWYVFLKNKYQIHAAIIHMKK